VQTRNSVRWWGLAGVAGLALSGIGGFAGCSSGESSDGHQEGRGSQVKDDGHAGHDHGGTREAPAKGTEAPAGASATAELKPMQPSASYPLKTCVVSGDSLTEMGGPIAFDYGGTEVQLCCQGCIKTFKQDPEAFMAKVRAAKK
jgi:YHS domain-containing protein